MREVGLALKAKNIRENIVNCIGSLGIGHIGGCLSIADLLAVLYGKHLKFDASNPKMEGRDRLVCSKGHAGPAIYSVLAEFGYFPKEVLETLTEREQKVLRLRFGLDDGEAKTLEEVGKKFNVTRERIRQIEAKALRKLRHPSRSRKLKDYLD